MMGPVFTKPPAVMGRFSESRTGAWVPPVLTPPMAWGADSGACGGCSGTAPWPRTTHGENSSDRESRIRLRQSKQVTPLWVTPKHKGFGADGRLGTRESRPVRLGVLDHGVAPV